MKRQNDPYSVRCPACNARPGVLCVTVIEDDGRAALVGCFEPHEDRIARATPATKYQLTAASGVVRVVEGGARPTITSTDVAAWLDARIAELSIVGRPLTEDELFRHDAFSQARDAITLEQLHLRGDL